MTGTIETYEADTLSILVIVTQDGEAKDLTGATVAAEARRQGDLASDVVATTTVVDAAAGKIGVALEAGALSWGPWKLQVRATIGDETQTVAEIPIKVAASYV